MSHDFNHILLGAMFNLKTHTHRKTREEGRNTPNPLVFDTPYTKVSRRSSRETGLFNVNSCHETLGPPLSFLKKTLEQTLPKIKDEIQDPDLLNQTEPARGVPCYFLGGYLMITKILFESHAILRFRVIDVETMNISGLAWDESNISLLCWVFH